MRGKGIILPLVSVLLFFIPPLSFAEDPHIAVSGNSSVIYFDVSDFDYIEIGGPGEYYLKSTSNPVEPDLEFPDGSYKFQVGVTTSNRTAMTENTFTNQEQGRSDDQLRTYNRVVIGYKGSFRISEGIVYDPTGAMETE